MNSRDLCEVEDGACFQVPEMSEGFLSRTAAFLNRRSFEKRAKRGGMRLPVNVPDYRAHDI